VTPRGERDEIGESEKVCGGRQINALLKRITFLGMNRASRR
jgi:hypothetical protein